MTRVFNVIGVCLLLLLISCTDDPSSIGEDLIPSGDAIKLDTLDSFEHDLDLTFEVFKDDSVDFSVSGDLLLGKNGTLESAVFLKYFIFLPDSIFNPLDEDKNSINVIESWIEMTRSYSLGDTLSNFDLVGYSVNSDWTSGELFREDFDTLITGQGLDKTKDVAGVPEFINNDTVKVSIDTDLVKKWVVNSIDSDMEENHGVYLKSDGTENVLFGFYAITGTDIEKVSKLKMVFEKPGEFIDTITASISNDIHLFDGALPDEMADRFILHGGFPTRAKVKFDVSLLPADAVINKATFEFSADSVNSVEGTLETEQFLSSFYTDTTYYKVNTNLGISAFSRVSQRFSGDITSYVQRWNTNYENYGFRLSMFDEISTANKLVIYKESISESYLRPRIIITYSTQK